MSLSYQERIEAAIHQAYSYPKNPNKKEQFADIRESFKQLALHMARVLPESPETSESLKKIEEAAMWASAAVARQPA